MQEQIKLVDRRPLKKSTIIMYWIVRILVLGLLVYSVIGLFLARTDDSQLGDFGFIAINAIALLLASFLPAWVNKRWGIIVPDLFLRIYLGFATAALLLGEIGGFFVHVSWWDSALHLFSGSLIGVVGFSLLNILNKDPNIEFHLSPGFIALFVFCFSLAVGVIWEIFEFVVDGLAGSNMQRFRDSITNELWLGRKALSDTMKDFILNTIGALVITILGYFDLKHRSGWMIKMSLRRKRKVKKHVDMVERNNEKIN